MVAGEIRITRRITVLGITHITEVTLTHHGTDLIIAGVGDTTIIIITIIRTGEILTTDIRLTTRVTDADTMTVTTAQGIITTILTETEETTPAVTEEEVAEIMHLLPLMETEVLQDELLEVLLQTEVL